MLEKYLTNFQLKFDVKEFWMIHYYSKSYWKAFARYLVKGSYSYYCFYQDMKYIKWGKNEGYAYLWVGQYYGFVWSCICFIFSSPVMNWLFAFLLLIIPFHDSIVHVSAFCICWPFLDNNMLLPFRHLKKVSRKGQSDHRCKNHHKQTRRAHS